MFCLRCMFSDVGAGSEGYSLLLRHVPEHLIRIATRDYVSAECAWGVWWFTWSRSIWDGSKVWTPLRDDRPNSSHRTRLHHQPRSPKMFASVVRYVFFFYDKQTAHGKECYMFMRHVPEHLLWSIARDRVSAECAWESGGSHDLAQTGPGLRSVRISVMIVRNSPIMSASTNSQGRGRHSPRLFDMQFFFRWRTESARDRLLCVYETCSVTLELDHYERLCQRRVRLGSLMVHMISLNLGRN